MIEKSCARSGRKRALRHVTFATLGILLAATVHASASRYLFAQPNASAAASISFANDTVWIAPVAPGSRVVLFTASLQNSDGVIRQSTGAKIFVDEDRDGAIGHRPSGGIPLRSLWIAVDLDTGRYGFATPSASLDALLPFPTSLLKRDAEGVLGLFDQQQLSAEMLVVRPGEGAWRLRAHEGGNGDADRTHNGKLSLASADAEPVGTSPPAPKKLKKGDVLAVIYPARLEAFVTEIDK